MYKSLGRLQSTRRVGTMSPCCRPWRDRTPQQGTRCMQFDFPQRKSLLGTAQALQLPRGMHTPQGKVYTPSFHHPQPVCQVDRVQELQPQHCTSGLAGKGGKRSGHPKKSPQRKLGALHQDCMHAQGGKAGMLSYCLWSTCRSSMEPGIDGARCMQTQEGNWRTVKRLHRTCTDLKHIAEAEKWTNHM